MATLSLEGSGLLVGARNIQGVAQHKTGLSVWDGWDGWDWDGWDGDGWDGWDGDF